MKARITKETLTRIVEAAKVALVMVQDANLDDYDKDSIWMIYGRLCDALFELSEERIELEGDFDESLTMKLLKSNLQAADIAELYMAMAFRKGAGRDTNRN